MTWRERRIVTILTAIALVLAAALLIVLGIRFRQWRAASESGAAVGADGTGTAADPAAYTALTYENGSTTLSFARDEAGQWAWTADGDFPLDDTVIQKILDQLVNWDPQQTLTDEEALAGSGLDEPTASLTASAAEPSAYIVTPRSKNFLARRMASYLSTSLTDMYTPRSGLSISILNPAAVSPLKSASTRFLPTPSTSPVDFISGPNIELTFLSFSKENTGTFAVT